MNESDSREQDQQLGADEDSPGAKAEHTGGTDWVSAKEAREAHWERVKANAPGGGVHRMVRHIRMYKYDLGAKFWNTRLGDLAYRTISNAWERLKSAVRSDETKN